MFKTDQYRQFAHDCVVWARIAISDEQRELFCAQGVVTYHDWACRMGYWSVLGCAGQGQTEPEEWENTYSPPARRP
jgi:hypothetical protein